MKKLLFKFKWTHVLSSPYVFFFIFFLITINSFSQSGPAKIWEKSFGGKSSDYINSWVETSDGYIIGGQSSSSVGFEKTSPGKGGIDYWIIKMDKSGNKIWDKTFGGANDDILKKIIKTSDGFLLCGSSNSQLSGDKSQGSRGNDDYWIVKINNNGIKVWDKTFGGTLADILVDAVLTSDNGFVLAGTSTSGKGGDKSEGGKSVTNGSDYWAVRINANGVKVWDKTFGGALSSYGYDDDRLTCLTTSTDGGFVLGGSSNSSAGFDKSKDGHGFNFNLWIVKINANGTKVWDKTFVNPYEEDLTGIVNTPDNGFILGGLFTVIQYSEFGEVELFYSQLAIKKITSTGAITWQKEINTSQFGGGGILNMVSISSNSSCFSLLYSNETLSNYLAEYSWEGINRNFRKLEDESFNELLFHKYSNTNESFIGKIVNNDGPRYGDFGLIKFDKEILNPAAGLSLVLTEGDEKSLNILAIPIYFNEEVSKVEFYANGVKVGEDYGFPFEFNWKNNSVGDYKISAKAIGIKTSALSASIPWKVFPYKGYQVENNFFAVSDVGNQKIAPEYYPTLNGGSSVRIWDIGDRVRFYLPIGNYTVKIRLRSGHTTATTSNITSYWPNGYSFWLNEGPVTMTGDPVSISPKDQSYGGSYWGTMTSQVLNVTEPDSRFEVQSNKVGGGIDYLELIPVSNRIESENNYTILSDVGTNSILKASSRALSGGSSTRIIDKGDKIRITFNSKGGTYIVKTHLRSGGYTPSSSNPKSYWPNGYIFWLDDKPTAFTGDVSSISTSNPSYGGSYWGTMISKTVTLTKGLHRLDIMANHSNGGVDYIELEQVSPKARIALEETISVSQNVYPNPFNNTINIDFPINTTKEVGLTISDATGTVYLDKNEKLINENSIILDLSGYNLGAGFYILKVNNAGTKTVHRIIKE